MAEQIRIRWFPNSWLEVRVDGTIVTFDPAYLKTYFAGYDDKTDFSSWPDPIDGLPHGLSIADLALITHHHKDHCKRVTLDRVTDDHTRILAPAACRKELGGDFEEVEPGMRVEVGDFRVRVVHAFNTESGTSTHKQHKKGVGVGYVLEAPSATLYHAGDTDFIDDMEELGAIDIAFVPVGGKFTMDFHEAVEATRAIQPRVVVPIHHLKSDPTEFGRALAERSDIECVIPEIGQELVFGPFER